MDFDLPDSQTMDRMAQEFEKLRLPSRARSLGVAIAQAQSAPPPDLRLQSDIGFVARAFLILYFVSLMSYNMRYGSEISYTYGNMGGLRSFRGAFGEVNNLR